jgi:hypothetical protein
MKEMMEKVRQELAIPTHIKNELLEMATALGRRYECCICMEPPEPMNLEVSSCGHWFCKPCFAKAKELSPLCAVCRGCLAKAKELSPPCAVCRGKPGISIMVVDKCINKCMWFLLFLSLLFFYLKCVLLMKM